MHWTPKHVLVGCVLVFKRRGGGVDVSDTRNMPKMGLFLVFKTRGRRGGQVGHQNTPNTPNEDVFWYLVQGKGWGCIGV